MDEEDFKNPELTKNNPALDAINHLIESATPKERAGQCKLDGKTANWWPLPARRSHGVAEHQYDRIAPQEELRNEPVLFKAANVRARVRVVT